jgi:hypothetical protein
MLWIGEVNSEFNMITILKQQIQSRMYRATRTPEKSESRIRCHGGVSILYIYKMTRRQCQYENESLIKGRRQVIQHIVQ